MLCAGILPEAAVLQSVNEGDPTLCSICSTSMIFCRDPACFKPYCEACATRDQNYQGFRFCGADPTCTKCDSSQPNGPYCQQHLLKHLQECAGCEGSYCELLDCKTCVAQVCSECLLDGDCGRCAYDMDARARAVTGPLRWR